MFDSLFVLCVGIACYGVSIPLLRYFTRKYNDGPMPALARGPVFAAHEKLSWAPDQQRITRWH
jgi:hypothetical protein